MKVIPVIDVLNGIVVHAVRGRRKEYQPLKSVLCNSFDSLQVAKAFEACGFAELYLADLDAIIGKSPNYEVLRGIADETGLKLMVDAGVTELKTANKLVESRVSQVIIGTETLQNADFVKEALGLLGGDRVIVSLDLMGGKVLGSLGFEGCKSPECLLREFVAMGVSQFIVLDLAKVGSSEGVNLAFVKDVLGVLPIKVYVGGGVRNIADLAELKKLGVSGVLLASALHSGAISMADLKQAGLL